MGAAMVHETAIVAPGAEIGEGSRVWAFAHIRDGAQVGADCVISKGVYVDAGVRIGSRCKIQNNVSVFAGVSIEDGVFVGPHVCFTNDKVPRAVNRDGSPKDASNWSIVRTLVQRGASIGANATVLCGIIIGECAMVGAGAVVTHNVPDHALVVGNPARIVGWVCSCGERIEREDVVKGCSHG